MVLLKDILNLSSKAANNLKKLNKKMKKDFIFILSRCLFSLSYNFSCYQFYGQTCEGNNNNPDDYNLKVFVYTAQKQLIKYQKNNKSILLIIKNEMNLTKIHFLILLDCLFAIIIFFSCFKTKRFFYCLIFLKIL
jgi:hypothetical protein